MSQAEVDDEAIAGAKQLLRRAVQLRRDSRSAEQRAAGDEARLSVVTEALAGRLPDTVAAYLSTGAEPGTLQLVAWLAAHRVRVLLPVLSAGPDRTKRREPAWAPYAGPEALRVGVHSILEPTTEPLPSDQLPEAELVICPALAANRVGDRLGRGGGWYDRALQHASKSAPVWVLLNADEILDTIPTHRWDRRVDGIITPDELVTCEPPVRTR